MREFKNIGKPVRKIDAVSLVTGNEKFTDDFAVESPLYIAFLYSPYAHAEILDVNISVAEKVPGVADILYYKNVPAVYHTTAGQGYPEPSPYDTLLFDKKVRFIGDKVALVAAETEKAAKEAVKKIKVEYEVLKPLFDIEKAMESTSPRIHDGEEYTKIPFIYQPEKNLAAEVKIGFGSLKAGEEDADFVEEHVYSMHYASHCAIEPHAATAYIDEKGRLVIISTTQVPFHARRIVSKLLSIPVRDIRVIKPRIGGGFGGKQEVILEQYVALVAWRNKRAAKITFSRKEVFVSSRTRHPMRVRLRTGFKKNGEITSFDMDALMNAGAYGSHALTVLSNAGAKVLPLFNKIENLVFSGRSVYTNLPVGGAYRGDGATQGYFAFNQQIDMIARKTGQDLLEYIKKHHIKKGETSGIFKILGEGKEGVSQVIKSCELSECVDRGAKAIHWYDKRDKKIRVGKNKVKGVGLCVAMQGSCIPKIDMGSASMKMNEDGSFNLFIGATDLGTGSDTIMAQIASEVLQLPVDKILVLSSDTDLTPFDVGAYASSTTYISGGAVKKCADRILELLIETASRMMDCSPGGLYAADEKIIDRKTGRGVTLEEIAYYTLYNRDQFQIQASASHVSPESPSPFIAQFAEVDVDELTGEIEVVKFVSAVDCGQPLNPVLAEGQVEGAVVNGLSYALREEYHYNANGALLNGNFGNYKIYTAPDINCLETVIVDSYEETGPFGAKSVGEIAINGPAPAIANAVFDAVGVRLFETPFTPERVLMKINEKNERA